MYYTGKVQSDEDLQRQAADLMNDPLYRKLGCDHGAYHAQLNLFFCVIFRVVLFLVFGWQCVVGNLIATFTIFWSTQFVNAFCHLPGLGYRTYKTTEDSRNVWWVGLLAVGEGWHNNHHAVPKSARHGLQWWEFDFTWCCIVVLEKLGLAKRVVRPSKVLLEKKRETSVLGKAQQNISAAMTHAAEAAQKAAERASAAVHEAAEGAYLAAEAAGKSAREAAEAASYAARDAAEHAGKAAREAALAAGKTASEAAEAASFAARDAVETAEIAIAQLVPNKESVAG